MAEKLKRFFKKKKSDITFKKAGPGYRLDDSSTPSVSSQSSSKEYHPVPNRTGLTAESKQAAAAALARLESQKPRGAPGFNT